MVLGMEGRWGTSTMITAFLLIAPLHVLAPANPLAGPQSSLKMKLFGRSVPVSRALVKRLPKLASSSDGTDRDTADVLILSFQDGATFMPEREIMLTIHIDPKAKLDGLRWTQPAVRFGTAEYSKVIHGHKSGSSCGRGVIGASLTYEAPGQKKESELLGDQIAFKFSSRSASGGYYIGEIEAYIPLFKSSVVGSFRFKSESK